MKCSSCGTNVSKHGKYVYCDTCEKERTDPAIRPLVWEFIGGVRGAQPNKRGPIAYTLASSGYTLWGERYGLPIYTRQPDNLPKGSIAMITHDQHVVIVDGEFELDSLMNHPCGFGDNPVVENLPQYIESLHPERADIVSKLRKDAGLD
jgi:hypothetical protein